MLIDFFKYHGAGNDFIIIEDKNNISLTLNEHNIAHLCDRHFGIGADGIMLLQPSSKYDFKMKYYNSDGKEGTMCGNGGRCIVAFANKLNLIDKTTEFEAIDGIHKATISGNTISLKMIDVNDYDENDGNYIINTGSPHYISFQRNISDLNLIEKAHKIRYNEKFKNEGINVNFVSINEDEIQLRTYERGVENETLACGTGAVATAIATFISGKSMNSNLGINVKGGLLNVSFDTTDNIHFTNIWLRGSAEFVFKGKILL